MKRFTRALIALGFFIITMGIIEVASAQDLNERIARCDAMFDRAVYARVRKQADDYKKTQLDPFRGANRLPDQEYWKRHYRYEYLDAVAESFRFNAMARVGRCKLDVRAQMADAAEAAANAAAAASSR